MGAGGSTVLGIIPKNTNFFDCFPNIATTQLYAVNSEAVTGPNIPSAPATPVPQAPKPVVKEDWANCSEHKETLNSFKKC